jgi:hypothetical protein
MKPMVPETAMGIPNADEVATHWRIGTLQKLISGMLRKPPPAPTSADATPTAPAPSCRPSGPGRRFVAFGLMSSIMFTAE